MDVIEKMNLEMERNGTVKSSNIRGLIKMKAFIEKQTDIKLTFQTPIDVQQEGDLRQLFSKFM